MSDIYRHYSGTADRRSLPVRESTQKHQAGGVVESVRNVNGGEATCRADTQKLARPESDFVRPLSSNCQPLHPLVGTGGDHEEQQPGAVSVLTWRSDVPHERCGKRVDAADRHIHHPLLWHHRNRTLPDPVSDDARPWRKVGGFVAWRDNEKKWV